MVDIGDGRRLRLVCEGPARPTRPVVWFESGAWGGAADWAAVQEKLAAEDVRSCAYDRAGMGASDPGPKPRDARAIAADFDRLITASGEQGPFVFVAHSAGGLYQRQFLSFRPELVRGLVLVEAMSPELVRLPQFQRLVGAAGGFATLGSWAASMGLLKPAALLGAGDSIGLPDAASAERRRAFSSGRHQRVAAAEVKAWRASVEQVGVTPPFPPEWPVAVVFSRSDSGLGAAINAARAGPAEQSRHGRLIEVAGASHTTLLGKIYGGQIVEAIRFVSDAPT
jgi:pimeloyl-ACP methyl ester carboxylesterase